jgi:two-component system, OmpR family, phosphate regulon response regulator OmpR
MFVACSKSGYFSQMNQALILLVEDDARLRELTERYLLSQNFRVKSVANLAGLHAQMNQAHIDLVVLDLGLPDGDGLHACRDLRAQNVQTPIIVLTARGDDIDRIVGLEFGADDYLAKPCNPRELVARIKAVLRRSQASVPAPQNEADIVFGPNVLSPSTRTLMRDGVSVRLTSGEFALLWALLIRPNRPLSRDQLLNLAFDRDYVANDRSIDVMISRLRKLIEVDPRTPRWLQTQWGAGYVFVPPNAEDRKHA